MKSFIFQVENSDHPMQGNLTVLDSQLCAMDTAFLILCQWNLDSGFNHKWDPECLTFIPDSKAQDSRFQEKNFLDSRFPYFGQQ